jgi:hypothetical protein
VSGWEFLSGHQLGRLSANPTGSSDFDTLRGGRIDGANAMMPLRERALYHQIHPLKLGTDILASIVSLYFLWQHELVIGLVLHFLPPIIVSGLLMRYGELERYRESFLGRYVGRYMTRTIEGVRLFGDLVTIMAAWNHDWLLLAAGFAVVLGAWCNGLLPTKQTRR